ncbi:YfiR family protein [Pseudomaricurvus sp.]|uniref:YfiR family protein n=1 Tax=Pseudomaricurvus sp. TaxID=2004510 RepID=UPI003F6D9927
MYLKMMQCVGSVNRTQWIYPLVLCLCATLSLSVMAEDEAVSAQALQLQKVKAVFVLNIAKFVRWPADVVAAHKEHLTLCYYREDVLGSAYDVIHDHTVDGRQLALQRITDADNLAVCDLLLLSEAGMEQYLRAPLVSGETPLLVVADLTAHESTGKGYPGVHVALVRKGSKLGFDVNLSAAHRSGLKFSSRLLRLARIVDENT